MNRNIHVTNMGYFPKSWEILLPLVILVKREKMQLPHLMTWPKTLFKAEKD